MKRLLATVRDLLLPPVCGNCRKAGKLLCDGCYRQIQWVEAPICPCCGRMVATTAVTCHYCRQNPLPLQQIRAATLFTEPVSTIIHKMKYEGMFGLAELLATLMTQAWPRWQMPADYIVPVPLHPDREKKRGYNQSALLAKRLGRSSGFPYMPGVLKRIRNTPPQVGLTVVERLTNVHGAFAVGRSEIFNKTILLVDDVCTTGATLTAAAQALLDAGAHSVSGYCLARTM